MRLRSRWALAAAAADLGAADWNCASAFSSWPVARYSSPSSFVAWALPALAAASKSGCGPWAGSDVGDGMGAIAWLTNHSRYLVRPGVPLVNCWIQGMAAAGLGALRHPMIWHHAKPAGAKGCRSAWACSNQCCAWAVSVGVPTPCRLSRPSSQAASAGLVGVLGDGVVDGRFGVAGAGALPSAAARSACTAFSTRRGLFVGADGEGACSVSGSRPFSTDSDMPLAAACTTTGENKQSPSAAIHSRLVGEANSRRCGSDMGLPQCSYLRGSGAAEVAVGVRRGTTFQYTALPV